MATTKINRIRVERNSEEWKKIGFNQVEYLMLVGHLSKLWLFLEALSCFATLGHTWSKKLSRQKCRFQDNNLKLLGILLA